MYLSSKIFCCFMLLFGVLSSESQGNSTESDDQKRNLMVQINLLESSMIYSNDKSSQHDAIKNSIKNIEMQYKLYVNSTKNNIKNDNDWKRYESREYIKADCERSKQMELDANFSEINDSMLQEIEYLFKTKNESNSTSCEDENFHTNNNIEVIFVSNEECDNVSCIQLCCPFTDKLTINGCVEKGNGSFFFPPFIAYANSSEHVIFNVTFHDPCVLQGFQHSLFNSKIYDFYEDGTIGDPTTNKSISSTDYCFAIVHQNNYDVIVCNEIKKKKKKKTFYLYLYGTATLISLPFLLLTFVIYSILPDLRNIHGYILRAHVASLFVFNAIYIFLATRKIIKIDQHVQILKDDTFCNSLVYFWNFFLLSNFFWLNVTCFDIWWSFRELRLHRTNVKQEKKKFMIYSIYAWGMPLIFNIIFAILDYVKIPNWPKRCLQKFSFSGGNRVRRLFFLIPVGITLISNICFFIATTVIIMYQNKRTAKELRDLESTRHNKNKQRFNMYLKLFIVMGISWFWEAIWWLFYDDYVALDIIDYFLNTLTTLQGLIIFLLFVCTKKIKQMLLKRFGGINCGPFGKFERIRRA
ncbi:G-protein coupled receptor Mth2 [Monomorium pharaonis]|uniref:G-protein coupled receptor Mth2 n=1 Tax=Monomorium pharaonis TaxID=307658 RepID=UPI00063F7F58|nr:G-protein coupled receptor Mth2 [Monomorium pharaonis]XP_012529835.1 G-protein coupled receptor Mth2 [Monomorium pharaonis]XP_036150921.1 G-protein coupled receptor Mth2 [Monomorium pharaonis]XP_036150929.1 G-protein coupled receptor Mth2 [Monomorium pharaonis]XP_036150934.1 G-protein coupled receptor Mth2 [Monomorium pharaonis]XP_036150942.1 G-protein coupled receptor Mth2 [Monomorium pharaonis]XP_036150954.1 G-protein coupled receptor Mth2 [Monomorium pharaonis]